MRTSLNVNEAVSPRSFSVTRSDHKAEGVGTIGVIGLLIAVGLVLFAVGYIYLNSVISPTDLPFLGQFIGT